MTTQEFCELSKNVGKILQMVDLRSYRKMKLKSTLLSRRRKRNLRGL